MATVYSGRIHTLNPHQDGAIDAFLVDDDGRIAAVGEVDSLRAAHPEAGLHALDGWVMPGLIEPHGHPSTAASMLSDAVVDIRPVVVDDPHDVMRIIRSSVASASGPVFINGWDPLLQQGLPSLDLRMLDHLAGSIPLVILHNSGHAVFFNSAAAALSGIDRSTPDPPGARFGRDDKGDLNGSAYEAGALGRLLAPMLERTRSEFPRIFADHLADLSSRGYTTVADMSWDPALNPLADSLRDAGRITTRIRWYEASHPGASVGSAMRSDDPLMRQVGAKIWSDGSPWVGNIATSFAYLDTPATRQLGLEPGHKAQANFSPEELAAVAAPYAAAGWQVACHAHGDVAISQTLDVYEHLIAQHQLDDHRFRLEHVGAATPELLRRAADLGVTVSVFVDHIRYWGEVLVNDLFGVEHGGAWADAGAAFAAGHRVTFHNDGWVTPNEPFRNMAVAETRQSRHGFTMPGGTPVLRAQALAAHTKNAAWQLFSEHEVGTLTVGRFADFIAVDRDPASVESESLGDTQVLATYLAGEQVAGR
ncbi:amidohydrolase [Salinibacterium hongtaonis]|uniref:Amidohydrolase n=1 Tax=Homoserinimonas hongtaonis TaxID=2079791 RepID=A0A2U1SY35_9MICO|nr:amidohydrolase family protein [Salinibacterium hongtaonis]PWB96516.1 amidohydrolase [Salinibacterium hongtaonis]